MRIPLFFAWLLHCSRKDDIIIDSIYHSTKAPKSHTTLLQAKKNNRSSQSLEFQVVTLSFFFARPSKRIKFLMTLISLPSHNPGNPSRESGTRRHAKTREAMQ